MPYKIRNKDNKWSSGGTTYNCKFTDKGKVWSTLTAVKLHLAQYISIPDDWEIVEIKVEVREVNAIKARHFRFLIDE